MIPFDASDTRMATSDGRRHIRAVIRTIVTELSPPVAVRLVRRLRARVRRQALAEWQYVPEGWRALQGNPKLTGWNVSSILDAYRNKWPQFLDSVEGPQPLGLSPEAGIPTRTNLTFHNIMMSYGYALALSTRHQDSISLLDWGGGIGHYYLLSRKLVPGLQIDYYCKDVPLLANYGQTLFPQAHFYTDDKCLDRTYDFVLASTSLHYSEDWASVLSKLARATAGSLFVTQLPTVQRVPSYVFVQRPYQFGYDTEYLGWCLNRQEFLDRARECGLTLAREFIVGHEPIIADAPEQCEYRGYLFSAPGTDLAKRDKSS